MMGIQMLFAQKVFEIFHRISALFLGLQSYKLIKIPITIRVK